MIRIISALFFALSLGFSSLALAEDAAPELANNAPDRHIVVQGDTLWGIAGKFLKEPWRWAEIWQINKEEIKNPHLIYPGDVVMLDRSGAKPRLRLAKGKGMGRSTDAMPQDEKLEPQVRRSDSEQFIPSIPSHIIEPFISRPLVIEPNADKDSAMIVATDEDRVLVASGDTAFATRIPGVSVEKWSIYRPGTPLIDPETAQVVAHEVFFLGTARLVKPGDIATIQIETAKEEIGRGDRLLPAGEPPIISYVPHAPKEKIAARVMSIYGGLKESGVNSVVSLNRGSKSGLEIGHVLALYRKRIATALDENVRRIQTPIPDERYGLIFVFRVFDNVAYALVMDANRSVIVGDAVVNP